MKFMNIAKAQAIKIVASIVLMLTPSVCFAQANAHMLAGINAQTGTSYTIVAADQIKLLTFNNASPVAVTLPAATNANFGAGTLFAVRNLGTGLVTITVTSGFIDGASTFPLGPGQGADIYSDGANYVTQKGTGANMSGMVFNQVPIATNSTTVTSSKPIQGVLDANILGSGTVSGVSAPLCTDANGGATTVACPSGGGGATPPNFQAQVYNNGAFASTPCFNVSAPSSGSALGNHDCDSHFKGVNPNTDITRYGARTCVSNTTPCASGLTASINSGSATATLSSASTFVNGDGIVIYGAGAAASVTSAPTGVTVTPSIATAGTGTGIVVNSATGGTTRCYKVIARDIGGGFTPASTEVCTTTGQPTLGEVTVNLTSCARSGKTVTCTLSSGTHPLVVGAGTEQLGEVYTSGTVGTFDNSFRGFNQVDTAVDTTHFTFINPTFTTAQGAPTASGSTGTASFYLCDHIAWTAVANAWEYYIYEGLSNAETLVGVSRPNVSGGVLGSTDTTFDYFGTDLMTGITFPPWIPTTPPTTGANDNLDTTINAGGGSTTLTLATTAGASVTSVGTRLDACPGILAAAAAAELNSPLYIPNDPSGNSFVINNFCDLRPFHLGIYQSGNLFVNETLAIGSNGSFGAPGNVRWTAGQNTAYANGPVSAGWSPNPQVFEKEGTPGVYVGGGNGITIDGVQFYSFNNNGANPLFIDAPPGGAFNINIKNASIGSSTASTDVIGFGLIIRNASGIWIDKTTLFAGSSADGRSHNSGFFCNNCGDTHIKTIYNVHRGMIYANNTGNGSIQIEEDHYNGGGTPLLTTSGSIGQITLNPGGGVIMDTVGHQCVASLIGSVSISVGGCGPSGTTFFSPAVTGPFVNNVVNPGRYNNSLIPFFTQNGVRETDAASVLDQLFDGPGAVGVSYLDSFIVNNAAPPAPTCVVNAGGSIPTAAYTFIVQPYWGSNALSEGVPSLPSAACTTTTGNQSVTLTVTPISGNPNKYGVFQSTGGAGYGLACDITPPNTSCTITAFTGNRVLNNFTPQAGPTMLQPGTNGVWAPVYNLSGPSASSISLTMPAGSGVNRSVGMPDNPGFIPTTGYQNSVYDNANRANGAIGSNWTVATNGVNIASNVFVGTASSATFAYWKVNSFSYGQFAQGTIVALNGTTESPGVAVLNSGTGAATSGYNCVEDTGHVYLERTTNGGNVVLTSPASTGAAGDILRLEVTPAGVLTCFKNGSSVATATDTTYTSGSPGLFFNGTVATMDNWSGGNLHPIAQLDMEQDWVSSAPQHYQSITIGATNPIPGTLGVGIYSSAWAPSSGVCTDSTSRLTTTACAGGSISGMTAGQLAVAGSASTITSSKAIQGSDANILSSSTVAAGTGNPLCTDTGSGATTTGCPNLSGLTSGQIPVAGSAITVTSSKAQQGTDTSILTSGTVSGTGATLCTDANGGATTVGCTGGSISGLTAGGVAIAGTATTITSSKPQQGTDANILTSGTISANTPALLCTDANSGATTANCSVYNTQSAATNANIAATNMVASAPSNTMYIYMWTVSLTTAGTGCTSTTSVVLNVILTDPSGASSQTESLGQISIAAGGNGTLGFVAQGVDNVYAKSGTAVQYSTSGYTPGTGCTVNPSYQVTMRLIPIS